MSSKNNNQSVESFKLTRKRDYKRSLKLPGYFAFTSMVFKFIFKNKGIFFKTILVFMALTVLFGLMGSQDIYLQLQEIMKATAPKDLFSGVWGEIAKSGTVLFYALSNGITPTLDPSQRLIAGFMALYLWLTVIFVSRSIIAKKPGKNSKKSVKKPRQVRLRDAIYNSGGPIIPTFLVFLILAMQLVPASIATIVYSAALQTQFLSGGVELMGATIAFALVIILTLYWIVPTFFAVVMVTIPGTYPLRALSISGDIVVSRRLRLIYRILWMIITVLLLWAVIMIPIIIFDAWIKTVWSAITWLPIVPFFILLMSTFSLVFVSVYVFLLYRKVLEDGSGPVQKSAE